MPDEVFTFGPLKIARFGRFIQYTNTSSPAEHAAFLQRTAKVHAEGIAELNAELARLQALIQKHDPIELMHRGTYMLLPLFMKHHSENDFSRDESYFLPTVEYLQYLIARTPVSISVEELNESDWHAIWGSATKVLNLTNGYLFTRGTTSTPPTELDHLRFALDQRRLLGRVRRYPIYFAADLRDSLSAYDASIREAYGIDIEQLVRGFEELHAYQKSGVLDRYRAAMDATDGLMRKLSEHGYALDSKAPADEERIRKALEAPEFAALHNEVTEKARLTFTSAIFEVTELTPLPRALLSVLSIRPGESVLTTLTGPNHDDLSPLSTSPLHYKPFVDKNKRFYFFYHSGFQDRIAEIIEDDLFARFPDRQASMRRRRDEHFETLAADLLATVLQPEVDHRNLFYPNPDRPGDLTELDALLSMDDVLFLVESKAGAFSEAAKRGAPQSLFESVSETIGTGQRQSERAEKYITSADEVPFFDATGQREVHRVRRAEFRRIFRIVVTREDLGWIGAKIAILSRLDPKMSSSFPWHVTLDDLRIVAELFKDSELRFVHFLEQRLKASAETALSQHDEIEHIGLYNKINLYHELPVKGPDRMTFDASFMRDIDYYFSAKYRGETPDIPKQEVPLKLADLLCALKNSSLPGRLEVASIILSMDDLGRKQLEDALTHLEDGRLAGKQRSFRMSFSDPRYGLTITCANGEAWQEELRRSAAMLEQAHCTRWLVVQTAQASPYLVSQIERILPGRFTNVDLTFAREYIEQMVQRVIQRRSVGRNETCPCGSGEKYKKCHGR